MRSATVRSGGEMSGMAPGLSVRGGAFVRAAVSRRRGAGGAVAELFGAADRSHCGAAGRGNVVSRRVVSVDRDQRVSCGSGGASFPLRAGTRRAGKTESGGRNKKVRIIFSLDKFD